jgi:uncharacterized protein (TIGR04255 family)
LLPDFVSLETTGYERWEDFAERLREALEAVARVVTPRVETRLGLRYVNELLFDDVESPSDWPTYLNHALVGELSTDEPLAASLVTLHQMLQFDVGDGARLTLRHGMPGEGAQDRKALTYLLDLDCFRQQERILDIDGVLTEASRFNTAITSLFQWCISEPLWQELEPHDK